MIELLRFLDHSRESDTTKPLGCLGEWYIDGEFQCYTIEPPWLDNKPFVSCIPVGEYQLEPYYSQKYGDVVAMVGEGVVANKHDAKEGDRYGCLVHSANWASQLQGCVAPGKNISWGTRSGHAPNIMVTASKTTLKELLPQITNETLSIQWKR